jgi:hypothetical protein
MKALKITPGSPVRDYLFVEAKNHYHKPLRGFLFVTRVLNGYFSKYLSNPVRIF